MWHNCLEFKLQQLGILGTPNDWLKHHITGRPLIVVIKGHMLLPDIFLSERSLGFNFLTIIVFFNSY